MASGKTLQLSIKIAGKIVTPALTGSILPGITRKSIIEFTGLNASTATLSITLDITQGVSPSECITDLYTAMNEHEALPFTLGGDVMGEGLWVIEGLDEKYVHVSAKGEVLRAEIDLKLKEYIENATE